MKGDLTSTHCSELNSDCEILWSETKVKGCRPMLIGAFYRPPKDNGDTIEELGKSFANLGNKINSHNIILTGDFNLPNINWNNNSISSKNGYSAKVAEQLINLAEEYGLTQHVTQPTRKQGASENILDLVFTNNPDIVEKVTVVDGIADHSSVIVDLKIAPFRKRPVKRKIFLYNKADTDGITQALEDFSNEYFKINKGMTVHDKWDCIKTTILQTMASYVPHKFTSSRFNLPWFDRTLRRAVRRKQRLYNKAIKSGKISDWEVFRDFRRHTHKLIKTTRSSYIRNILGSAIKEEPKKFWKFIKNLRQENTGVAELEKDGQIISDDTEKANILNEQFQSVFTDEPPGELPSLGTSPHEQIGPLNITTWGLEKLLSQLEPNKAPGPDGIPPWFLKLGAKQLASPLQDLFQCSINTGEVPQDWKEANIAPIYKKGSRTCAANYRPISLTSVVCKILEHIVHSHVMKHLENHHILSDFQHGFRAKKSTETQLILTIHDISNELNKNNLVDAAVLDFTKAFDTVPHRRLISKLQYYGIGGKISTWVQNFLTRAFPESCH